VENMAETSKNGASTTGTQELLGGDEEEDRSVASVENQLRKEMTVYEVCGKINGQLIIMTYFNYPIPRLENPWNVCYLTFNLRRLIYVVEKQFLMDLLQQIGFHAQGQGKYLMKKHTRE